MSPQGRILAVDYGSKRVGLALSDPMRLFAKPLKVLLNTGFSAVLTGIRDAIAEHDARLLLVGMPYAIAGGSTPKTLEVKGFIDKLAARVEIPVLGWDERYSTDEAVAELIKLGYGWKERREFQDAMAAALILKDYLNRQ